MLITGPWTEAAEHYSCVFDHIAVPGSLVQPGVLRCYCPGMGTRDGTGTGDGRIAPGRLASRKCWERPCRILSLSPVSPQWADVPQAHVSEGLGSGLRNLVLGSLVASDRSAPFLGPWPPLLWGQAFALTGLQCPSRPSGLVRVSLWFQSREHEKGDTLVSSNLSWTEGHCLLDLGCPVW